MCGDVRLSDSISATVVLKIIDSIIEQTKTIIRVSVIARINQCIEAV
jgi:hypothetical protein